ncbi:hypothetical protein AB4Z09_22330 [Rhodococcus sp. TAF43]|uniref:hypothetical protein n=1 Tax=Rhodococcus sp. TAF43 TaxID=3237483 RepID=UPI003F9BF183
MSRTLTRRIAASVAAAAIVVGGVGLGAGTAIAAPSTGSAGSLGSSDAGPAADGVVPQPGVSYPQEGTRDTSNIRVTKRVVGDGTVAPGQIVTYRTTISTTGHPERYINKITDYHPAGFTYVQGSAQVTAWHALGGSKTEKVTPQVNANTNSVTVTDSGWLISPTGSKTVSFEASYLVPRNVTVGNVHNSGVAFDVSFFGSTQNFDPIDAWVKIRSQNPGEAVSTGSADLGFGSSNPEGGATGSAGSGIINDPAGFIADIISNVFKNGS